MRPYMLWLTRVYAGITPAYGTAFLTWDNVVSDWARRLREHEFLSAIFPRQKPPARYPGLDRAIRNGTMAESRRPGAAILEEWRREARAVQGGR